MRHSDFTGLVPANDLPRDDRQPMFIGMDLATQPDVTAVFSHDADGGVTLHEVIEGDAEPQTEAGRAVYGEPR